MSTPAEARAFTRASWVPPVVLGVIAFGLRLPAFFASRHLEFDESVYGASVIAMRHGQLPYRDLFSAQGPLHFPLLYAGDLLGFRTINSPRVTSVLAGVGATVVVWAIGRRIGGPTGAFLAGALVATTGTMLWTTGQITGDGPAGALAVGAVWAALVYRGDGRLRTAVVTGALIGAALAVKPLLFTAAVPVGLWLWTRKRFDHVAAAVAAAGVVWLGAALPWGLGRVWDQSIVYNTTGAGPRFGKVEQLRKLFSTLGDRDAVVLGAVLLGVVAAVAARRADDDRDATGRRRVDTIVVVVWLVVTALVLVLENALYRNHVAAIIPPLALLTAMHPPPWRWLAVALIALAPYWVVHVDDIVHPPGYRGSAARAAAALRALPRDAQAISDDPGFVWRAGLTTPRLLNDTSQKRIDQGLLTTRLVADAAADAKVCAVLVWTPRFGKELPGLPAALSRAGLHVAETYPRDRALWLRQPCTPAP